MTMGISFEICETPSEGPIPILILPNTHSILNLGALSVDVGERYFMVMATDAWGYFNDNIGKESNFIVCKEEPNKSVELLSFPVGDELLLLIQKKGGVLVVDAAFDVFSYENGNLNAFLLGVWNKSLGLKEKRD